MIMLYVKHFQYVEISGYNMVLHIVLYRLFEDMVNNHWIQCAHLALDKSETITNFNNILYN